MIVDQIKDLARRWGVSTNPDPTLVFGYRCSYAGWLLAKVETRMGIGRSDEQLGARFRRCLHEEMAS